MYNFSSKIKLRICFNWFIRIRYLKDSLVGFGKSWYTYLACMFAKRYSGYINQTRFDIHHPLFNGPHQCWVNKRLAKKVTKICLLLTPCQSTNQIDFERKKGESWWIVSANNQGISLGHAASLLGEVSNTPFRCNVSLL